MKQLEEKNTLGNFVEGKGNVPFKQNCLVISWFGDFCYCTRYSLLLLPERMINPFSLWPTHHPATANTNWWLPASSNRTCHCHASLALTEVGRKLPQWQWWRKGGWWYWLWSLFNTPNRSHFMVWKYTVHSKMRDSFQSQWVSKILETI